MSCDTTGLTKISCKTCASSGSPWTIANQNHRLMIDKDNKLKVNANVGDFQKGDIVKQIGTDCDITAENIERKFKKYGFTDERTIDVWVSNCARFGQWGKTGCDYSTPTTAPTSLQKSECDTSKLTLRNCMFCASSGNLWLMSYMGAVDPNNKLRLQTNMWGFEEGDLLKQIEDDCDITAENITEGGRCNRCWGR